MKSVHTKASQDYRQARAELLTAERELRNQTERVAALRRMLPPGPEVDAALPLTMASGKPTTLGGLFGAHDTLVTYNLMYDEGWSAPCPMCAMWVDGLDAQVPHLNERTAVAVVAPASPGQLAAMAEQRRWRWIPVASTQPGDLTERLGVRTAPDPGLTEVLQVEAATGLVPAVTVYRLDRGTVRVHWHGSADLDDPGITDSGPYEADGGDARGIDPLCATWALLDLLPEGRGDWYPVKQSRP